MNREGGVAMSNTADVTRNEPERDVATGFRNVDRTGDAGYYVRFLERATGVERIRELKRHSYELMQVQPGQHVLDLGCGLGDDARALAAVVGSTGRAVGVDVSESMVTEARQRSEGTGLSVEFAVGDAHGLDFPAGSFDACRTERTLHYVADPARAVGEMVRVVKPGGRVVALEPDHETMVFYPGDKATTRTIAKAFADSIPNGWIGRQLLALFLDAGLVEVAALPHAILMTELELVRQLLLDAHLEKVKQTGLLPAHEVDAWLADLVDAGQRGRFLCSLTMFSVVGRKPPA
jgi:ubiquinone/menaquinone biosynthesis C-methylase UbiE